MKIISEMLNWWIMEGKSNFGLFEFSLNDFHWIQRIQWIKTKSKSSMVTRDTPYLTTDTFLDVVVNKDIFITISGMVSIHSGKSQWIFNQR